MSGSLDTRCQYKQFCHDINFLLVWIKKWKYSLSSSKNRNQLHTGLVTQTVHLGDERFAIITIIDGRYILTIFLAV